MHSIPTYLSSLFSFSTDMFDMVFVDDCIHYGYSLCTLPCTFFVVVVVVVN